MGSAFRSIWTFSLLAFVALALCVGAFAQGGSGELAGLVTDTTGAVVSGVEIKLSDVSTGEVRTTVTTPSGSYRFPALPIVGAYNLEVKSKGFKSVKVQNVVISVGVTTTRDIKLEVGAATEQITVEGGGTQLVQTEDSSLSQNVDKNVWANMPLEDRSSNAFIGLLPGAEPAMNANLTTDRGPAVNGTRSGSGNFMVEGFDNNDQGLGGGGSLVGPGGSNTTISPDAIEEYRVIEGTPSAEYGKTGGFVTDTVLKGGTNQWHGSLFEYNRIQALAANSWFSNNVGEKDRLVRNQFGGSVGGPIIKDKTFFYFTSEFHRLRTSSPLAANTFTSDFNTFVSSGAFEQFQEGTGIYNTAASTGICRTLSATVANPNGTPCPGALPGSGAIGPVFSSIAAADPLPLCVTGSANCPVKSQTAFAQGLWTGGTAAAILDGKTPGVPYKISDIQYPVNIYGTIHIAQPDSLDEARYSTKFDHKISSKDQLNAAYLYDNSDVTELYGGNASLGPTLSDHGRAQNAGVTWSHTFSPTVLNQARMAYVRHTANFPGDPRVAGAPSIETFFDEPTFGYGNAANIPQFFTENEFVYKDDLSVAHGKHNFKGGGEYRRTRNGSSFDSYKNGYIIINDVEDLLTDATFSNQLESYLTGNKGTIFGSIGESFTSLNPTTGTLPNYYRGYRANEVAAYFQDDWRVTSRLTVNLGVRWEYFGPPHNFQPGLDANFFQGTPVTPIPTISTNPFFPVNNPAYALFATGVVQQRNHDLWSKDLHNFGPRLGFAWDTMGNQKLIMRGGFGISYDRMYNNIFENARFNPPYFAVGELGTFGTGATITPAQTASIFTYPYTGVSTYAGAGLTPSLRAINQSLVSPYYEQAHLGFQYQIGKSMVLESNYVGTFGHQLLGIVGRNTFDGRFAGGDSTPLNPLYGNISYRTNCCDSNYHGWQTTLRRRFSDGLQFNANYTYSKAMDDVSDAFTTKNAGSAAYPTDSWNPKLDYGPADYDVRQRIVGSTVYDLPFAKSNRWIGGWSFTGIISWQTGADFSVINSSVDSNGDGQFNDRSAYIGSGKITNAINHNVSPATGYLNPTDFASFNTPNGLQCPASVNGGAWCDTGQMQRNSLVGPSFFNTDIGFHKSFKINERSAFRLEGNFFNIFNHPNFVPPNLQAGEGGANLNSPSIFGKSQATFTNQETGGPRITQLALRFDF